MDLSQLTRQTLALVSKGLLAKSTSGKLQKSISVPTGLTGYILEPQVSQLVPLLSDFRQSIPRKTIAGSNILNYKQITALSTPKLSTAEGAAGALFTTTVAPKAETYKVMALRGQVTREAEAASKGFEPALAKETSNCLLNYMKIEEQYILGGNVTAYAAPTGVAVAERDAHGTIGAVTVYVQVAAISMPAFNRTVANLPADWDAGGDALLAGSLAGVGLDITATGDGVGPLSTEVDSGAMTGTDNGARVSWTPIADAAAYLVFAGTTTGAANLKLEAVVTQANVTLTSLAGTGALASTLVATSADALSYDGILALVANGTGAYVQNIAAKLTGANGEIVEIQDAFQSLWQTAKLGEFRILVSGVDSRILTRLGVSQDSLRVVIQAGDGTAREEIVQGVHVGYIMNAIRGTKCKVEVLPWLPPGMILILPTRIPYNDANLTDPFDMVFAYDVERWDYASTPTTGPVYPFETRSFGALANRFPAGCALLHNIFKG